MRQKSLPISLRGVTPRSATTTATPRTSRDRTIDWFATIPVLFLVPAILAIGSFARAAGPSLDAVDAAVPGQAITVKAAGHRPGARVQVLWDGSTANFPIAKVDPTGRFSATITVPDTAVLGRHEVSTTYQVKRSSRGNAKVEASATVSVTEEVPDRPTPVGSLSADPRVRIEPSADPSPAGVAIDPTPAAQPSHSRLPDPTTAPTPPPADPPQSTPTPVQPPVATPRPATPAPTATPAPATPAPIVPAPPTSSCSTVVPAGASITTAMQNAKPGQTICLRGGTYAQNFSIDPPNGSPSARIALTAYPGERPVIKGLVRFSGLDYWTISGIGFTWNGGAYTDHMVKVMGGTGWLLQDVEMWGARSFANLLVYGSPHAWTIRDSIFRDTPGGESNGNRSHNLYVNAPNATNGLIQGNVFSNAPMGNNVKLSGSSLGTDGTDNVVFRGNVLASANRANLLLGNAANNNVIEGNVFGPSNDGWAIRLWDLRGSGNSVRNNVYTTPSLCNDYDSTVKCSHVVGTGNVR